jgi:hypothetical protein
MGNKADKFNPRDLSALNRFGLCNVQTGLFPTGNKQATTSNASQSRSESAIVINPKNSRNMIGLSKKFIDPAIYLFRLAPIYTFDEGNTWHESTLPVQPGWDGMTDPAVAFDNFGNAFIIGEPLKFNQDKIGTGEDVTGLGMVAYRSTDGGVTWGQPIELTTHSEDDKQWVVTDNHPASPYYGNVYAAFGAFSPLRFARSSDHGATWKGTGSDGPGSTVVPYSFSPEMSVSKDGTLHILWHIDGSGYIAYVRSTDGGNSFAPVQTIVTGISSLRGHLPITDSWPHFDNGRFRVITLVSDCVTDSGVLIVAWADMREGHSRIYYRRSLDNGMTWEGSLSGSPLLPNVSYGDMHCFHPQIVTTGTGVVGCAFYVFAKEFNQYLIRVQLAASWDDGSSFSEFITVTERSWDPLVNAPRVHGDPNVDFIGEYFGLDADEEDFALLWTDTRTGVQELFFDLVKTKRISCPHIPELVAQILTGVINDAGGWIIVGGKLGRVPPRSPEVAVLNALAAFEAVSELPVEERRELQIKTLRAAVRALEKQIEEL